MDGETENRQDVDVVEEQTDDTLSSDEVDITQPWPPAPTLAAAAANRSSPGLHPRSVTGISTSLYYYIEQKNPDIIGISETWFQEENRMTVPGYKCIRRDRIDRKGGGIF